MRGARGRAGPAWVWPVLAVLASACEGGRAPEGQQADATGAAPAAADAHADHGAPAPGAAVLPLKETMRGLEADMTGVLGALWIDDASGVAAAARRVADHPRVPPEEMALIQGTLGEAFAAFVGFDQAVHGAAVSLSERAAAGAPAAELLAEVTRIQEGCVGCHTAFRPRVSAALAGER